MVKGISMQPLLRDGRDELGLLPCNPATLEKGDVVLFRYRGRHVLHRIIRMDGDRMTLRGDNAYAEEHCRTKDIVGKVDKVYRRMNCGAEGKGEAQTEPVYREADPRAGRWLRAAALNHLRLNCRALLSRIYRYILRK